MYVCLSVCLSVYLSVYTSGLQSSSAGGHTDDFLRHGGSNVKKFNLLVKNNSGEETKGYLNYS